MKKLKEKKRIKMKKNQAKGITLIALVITIIVLLILAGVTIATLTGENGILIRANEAKNLYGKASFNEKIQIAVTPYRAENNFTLEDSELTSIINELNSYGDMETKKIPAYDRKIDLEIKDSNGNICLLTNQSDIIEKVEGNKKDWEISTYTDGSYRITKYIGENVENLVIPNYIDGNWIQSVRGIHSENSIIDGYNIKNIVISEGIKFLDTSSFYQCATIETVKLPNTLEKINWGVFYGCSNLKEINFPNSLKYIGQLAFELCISFPTEITLGENIEKIDTYAFSGSSVENVKINRKKDTVTINPRPVFQ